ncbi:putative selenophosphate synthetase, purM-like domain superfamily [Plasmopara halstedii]
MYSLLKGCDCKLPQAKLLDYLDDIANDLKTNETPGMDLSVVKIAHGKDRLRQRAFGCLCYGRHRGGHLANDSRSHQAQTNVTGGQTVMNPWPLVGGVAMSVRSESQTIRPENAVAGVSPSLLELRLHIRVHYGAHSATDVTGFGIVAHARNQAKSQREDVSFELHTLPIIKNMAKVNEAIRNTFRLLEGFAAETSGDLLLCLPAENANAFISELLELDSKPAWVVGRVVVSSKDAYILPNPACRHFRLNGILHSENCPLISFF